MDIWGDDLEHLCLLVVNRVKQKERFSDLDFVPDVIFEGQKKLITNAADKLIARLEKLKAENTPHATTPAD
jgi:hypothetical protein